MTKGIILVLGILTMAGCGAKTETQYEKKLTCFTAMGYLSDDASNVKRGSLGYEFSVAGGDILVEVPAANCIAVSEKKAAE